MKKFTIAYRFNDQLYSESFDSWIQAMNRYWKLVMEDKNPSMHFD